MHLTRHAQITQNTFVTSLQYFFEVSDEVHFLHVDKHESLQQIGIMILMGMSIPKVPKIASLQCL